jgi:hypothetical protein
MPDWLGCPLFRTLSEDQRTFAGQGKTDVDDPKRT